MMTWDELLACSLFLAAAGAIAWRACRAVFADPATGCGSSCGSCPSNTPTAPRTNLLLIEPISPSRDVKC